MGYTTFWKRLSPAQLNFAIQAFSLISIFFEGYDQGVMGGVNSSPRYVTEVGIGEPDGHVTNTVHQGGIVSVYYLGCIFGCFAGGWLADRIGRINGWVPGAVLSFGHRESVSRANLVVIRAQSLHRRFLLPHRRCPPGSHAVE